MASTARELKLAGVNVAEPVPLWDGEPVYQLAAGGCVSAWRYIPGVVGHVSLGRFGALLRDLHQVSPVPSLPAWAPLEMPRRRLQMTERAGVPPVLIDRLWQHFGLVQTELAYLRPDLGTGVVHGDADHTGNVVDTADGPLLIDLDDVALAPLEVDLAPTLVAYRRFGLTSGDWEEFCSGYGYDACSGETGETVARFRELTTVCWLLQWWGSSQRINAELRRRISSLGETGPPWTPWAITGDPGRLAD